MTYEKVSVYDVDWNPRLGHYCVYINDKGNFFVLSGIHPILAQEIYLALELVKLVVDDSCDLQLRPEIIISDPRFKPLATGRIKKMEIYESNKGIAMSRAYVKTKEGLEVLQDLEPSVATLIAVYYGVPIHVDRRLLDKVVKNGSHGIASS